MGEEFSYEGGELWAWPIPTDGTGVPDHPPMHLGAVIEATLVLEDETDDERGTDGP